MNWLSRRKFLLILLVSAWPLISTAQIEKPGNIWKYVTDPGLKIQLQRNNPSDYYSIYFKDFVSGKEESQNFCRFTFTGDPSNYSDAVYQFVLTSDGRANRAEMKVEYGNYQENGIYQMEGELRFMNGYPGPKEVCQIWQNMIRSGNKILIYRTQTKDNGTLYVPSSQDRTGTFKSKKNVYGDYNDANGHWLKVNVIHDRNTREVWIYLNGELYNKFIHYQADGDYYFKFGAYGKPDGESDSECRIEWRNMKFFEAATTGTTALQSEGPDREPLRIYPNPGRDQVNIYYPGKIGENIRITVYDLSGRVIKKFDRFVSSDNKPIRFSTDGLNHGTYVLKLESISSSAYGRLFVL